MYLNSSASDRTRFRCLSNAKNVPRRVRESDNVTRIRCSTYRRSFDPLPLVYCVHIMLAVAVTLIMIAAMMLYLPLWSSLSFTTIALVAAMMLCFTMNTAVSVVATVHKQH